MDRNHSITTVSPLWAAWGWAPLHHSSEQVQRPTSIQKGFVGNLWSFPGGSGADEENKVLLGALSVQGCSHFTPMKWLYEGP